ncbi:hypothetical protein MNBD_GAMMA21-518 [hydrothermal vent metagenome]|uniref:Uncharacterized protein n=1 Tax=hydrothermal vent metagenome TaxID=652676 RepID=A0A3B0ZYG4_9ZZZZ
MFKKSGYFFIVLLLLAVIGFWKSYFSLFFHDIDVYPQLSEVENYIHFHAATMLLWLGLLITQAFLIRFNKRSLHKIIGKFSYILIPVLAVSLVLLAHSQLTIQEFGLTYGRLYILFLQLSLLVIFMIAYGLAITYRHTPARHARYMICTALTMIDPAVARLPIDIPSLPFSYQVVTFGITDLILIILIILERKKTKGREVFPIMLGVFLFFQILNLTATRSQIWDDFGLWFARLPLT